MLTLFRQLVDAIVHYYLFERIVILAINQDTSSSLSS